MAFLRWEGGRVCVLIFARHRIRAIPIIDASSDHFIGGSLDARLQNGLILKVFVVTG